MEGHGVRSLPRPCRRPASRKRRHHRSCGLHDHRGGAEGGTASFCNASADRGDRRTEGGSGEHQGDHDRRSGVHRTARRHCRAGGGEHSAGADRVKDSLLPDELVNKAREVVEANRALGRRIAVAESCTGGLVSAALTEIAGSSDVFEAGYVTYSNAAKLSQLKVSEDVVDTFGAVSVATAWAMARGALAASDADIAVAITGIAGPGGGTAQKPVGTVVFARAERGADPAQIVADNKFFDEKTRSGVRLQAALCALELLMP